jgi:hypothetical protein
LAATALQRRYFETERDAWAFLTDRDADEIGKIAA